MDYKKMQIITQTIESGLTVAETIEKLQKADAYCQEQGSTTVPEVLVDSEEGTIFVAAYRLKTAEELAQSELDEKAKLERLQKRELRRAARIKA